ncbi:MAG: endolytic transglycosylase MltG [Pseudomonadota bacterium]
MKRVVIGALVLLSTGIVAVAFAFYKIDMEMHYPRQDMPAELFVERGESAIGLTNALIENNQLNMNVIWFKLWAKLNPDKLSLKAGLYELPPKISMYQLLEKIQSGDTKKFSVTLVEGLRVKDWFMQLSQISNLKQDLGEFDTLYARMIDGFGFCENAHQSIEGCLLADTYQYEYQSSAFELFKRARDMMKTYVDDQWQQRFAQVPLGSEYEALILASIIEKETAVAAERDVIAGVFTNRLHSGMRLQTDPTVIYGIGDSFDGNITRKHLRTLTPYNTYRIDGLPITPIAMPSRASIDAALQPASTGYVYFVSKGDGTHQFSETLEQHNQAVRKYQLGLD